MTMTPETASAAMATIIAKRAALRAPSQLTMPISPMTTALNQTIQGPSGTPK